MTRIAQNKTEKVDLSKPLNLDNFKLSEEGCFGKEWSPEDNICKYCHDIDTCGSIFQRITLKNRIKEVEGKQKAKFLDLVNFDRIPKEVLFSEIKAKSGKITSATIVKFVKHYSRCDDMSLVKDWIKKFKIEYKVSIKGGVASV